MNKKGFTMTELLAVIVILGIISTIAIPIYSRYINKADERYYKSLEGNVANSTKEYMAENINYLPKTNGSTIKIMGSNLVESGIIGKIVDTKDNNCTDTFVIVKRISNSKYEYTTCLVCDSYKTNKELCK